MAEDINGSQGAEIDNLKLNISVSSKTNPQKIESLAKSIGKLDDALFTFHDLKLEKLNNGLNALSSTFSAISTGGKQISSLSTRLSNLNKKLTTFDTSIMETKFQKMTSAITPFIEKITSAQDSLVALNGIISGSGKISNPKQPKNSKKSFLNAFKWGTVLHLSRRLGGFIAQISQRGADFTETLNLWETAMGNNLDTATKFVNKMNEAYGVSEKTLMNAQATFKNMLGSLGQISDETAYRLSEGVTQMALDYASLYNQTFAQAMTKFQAALAGQVRPIRSVSGFDITENTLFQLYQSLGGTKTMRQLTRTEKQLLSIYAIFQQMEASGTIGDLAKTMESFANQSRVASEEFQEIMQYSGILITHAIQQLGLMVKLNGFLIFLSDTLKAVAESQGAIQHFGDPFSSTTEGALAASEATDQLNGKLADFDKFRSLSTPQDNALNIDEKLLNALSQYESILSNASMDAKEFADNLKVASKLFDKNGVFNPERWKEIVRYAILFGSALLAIFSLKLAASLVKFVAGFFNLYNYIFLLIGVVGLLVLNWNKLTTFEKVIGVFAAIGAAALVAAAAIAAFHNSWTVGLATTAILGGLAAIIGGFALFKASLSNVEFKSDGGMVSKGTMFIAGEAGPELVTNMGGGQSGVMNMEQLENAVARGMLIGLSSVDFRDDRPINVNIDGQRFFTASRDIYKRNGYDITAIR